MPKVEEGPSEADVVGANEVQRLVVSGQTPGLRAHLRSWRSRTLAALGGGFALLSVACGSGASQSETAGKQPIAVAAAPEPTPLPRPTATATREPSPIPEPTVTAAVPAATPESTAIPPATPQPAAPAEAQTPTPEVEPQDECSFFKDPQFCGLAEVYQGTNPRTGKFKGVGIRAPKEPETVIEILSPIDGWLQLILDNPYRANISTDKVSVVEGWIVDGVEFNPVETAEAVPIKKGQVIGSLKDTGYRPLSYATDYIAYFGPRSNNVDAHIAGNFPSAAGKPIKDVEFKSPGTKIEQGPVIVIER